MIDLITKLCQIIAEIKHNNPQAHDEEVVILVKNRIDTNPSLKEAIQGDPRLYQINKEDSTGFQTVVTGGVAKIGIHLNDNVDWKTFQAVLEEILADNKSNKNPHEIPDNELIPVHLEGYWGYMDKSGERVISPQFNSAGKFSDGVAKITTGDGKYGFIDKTVRIISQLFDFMDDFSEGLARVKLNRKWGLSDKKGFLGRERKGYIDKTGKWIK